MYIPLWVGVIGYFPSGQMLSGQKPSGDMPSGHLPTPEVAKRTFAHPDLLYMYHPTIGT